MRKFLKKILIFGLYALVLAVLIPYLVDPYNVFHPLNIRNNGVEPNKNYIKMTYILNNPDKYDSFVFGSSRVGSIHSENIKGLNCYNMTYAGGVPREHLDNIKTFISKGIIPKRIYLGVDNISFTENYQEHVKFHQRAPYEYLKSNPNEFLSLYMNTPMVLDSIDMLTSGKGIEGYGHFYDYGWWCDYNHPVTEKWENLAYIESGRYVDSTLEDIKDIKEICDANGIELVVFTNPMFVLTYEASLDSGYVEFMNGLAKITPFYNFSGINDITVDESNYVDPSHYNAYIGDKMIQIMDGDNGSVIEDQWFGIKVDGTNINQFTEFLKSAK